MTVKIGRLPSINTFIPQTPLTQLGVVATTVASMHYAYSFTNDGTIAGLATTTALLSVWLYGRYTSLGLRDGYLLEKPIPKKIQSETNANWEMTNLFKKNGFDTVVYEKKIHQYRLLLIKNDDPEKVEKMRSKVSMHLGIDKEEISFIATYKKLTSAFLIPITEEQEWDDVDIDESQLIEGRLIGYIGLSIKSLHVTYDRRIEPHLLIAGSTNSGKTEAIRVDIYCMRKSGLNPEVILIDPKSNLKDIKGDFYTNDTEVAVNKLENLVAMGEIRLKKYGKAGCKNYFEYQKKVDKTERPLMAYIDELAVLLLPSIKEVLEKGETPLHKRAFYALHDIGFKLRSAGVFLTAGIQHPKADILDTLIKNNFGAVLAFSVASGKASEVAIDQRGAERLPKFGAFMFKTSLTNSPIFGRGAYLK